MRKSAWLKSFSACLSALFLLTSTAFAEEMSFFLFKKAEPMLTPAPAATEISIPNQKISTHKSRLYTTGGSFADLTAVYDGDETTAGGGEKPLFVTMDFAGFHYLSGVRFLPADTDKGWPNRIIGTKFYASADNRNFVLLGQIESNQDMSAIWQSISFDGVGRYRYVKMELPAGAYFREVEWLEYPSFEYSSAKAKHRLSFDLSATQIKKDFSADVFAAIYTPLGVLKSLSVTEAEFKKGQDKTINLELTNPKGRTGDILKIMVKDRAGALMCSAPVCYNLGTGAMGLSLPNIFSDNMLVQAEKPFTVWGNALPNTVITTELKDEAGVTVSRNAVANARGDFQVRLGNFGYAGDYTLTVRHGTHRLVYRNLTFGDVWLLTGQSNMEYYMLGNRDSADYLKNSHQDNPNIRIVNMLNKCIGGAGAVTQNIPTDTGWTELNSDTAAYFSSIGYYFAAALQREYSVPVGILSTAVGDTEINRWLPRGARFGSFTATDGTLYNNRIAPLSKLEIKGILMYQGEADQYRTHLSTEEYRDAMAGVVDHYRQLWGYDLPFYWAQLTRYQPKDESLVRDGQRLAQYKVKTPKNTGVISLLDIIGEFEDTSGNCRTDIHPSQKALVAERFLAFVKRDIYGEDIVPHGPVYESMEVDGDKLILTFSATGDLKVMPPERYADNKGMALIERTGVDTSSPQEFEVAGDDGVFVKADAVISGSQVILSADGVSAPRMARYAFGAYPEIPNLTDDTNLPALTFATHIVKD